MRNKEIHDLYVNDSLLVITINSVLQNLDEIDETLTERLVGLTEMFPESVRKGTSTAAKGMVSSAKWLYSVTGKTIWILSTSFVILALPVIFEVERVQTEEAQLQQQRQVSCTYWNVATGIYADLDHHTYMCMYYCLNFVKFSSNDKLFLDW